jgi:hypothetical protein
MITIETNTRSSRKTSSHSTLEIRFHFVDGSKETFIQANTEAAEAIRRRTDSSNLFNQSRIVVADDYSKSVFVGIQMQNLIGYTVYPGVPELPADTWMAQPKVM